MTCLLAEMIETSCRESRVDTGRLSLKYEKGKNEIYPSIDFYMIQGESLTLSGQFIKGDINFEKFRLRPASTRIRNPNRQCTEREKSFAHCTPRNNNNNNKKIDA